MMKRRVRKYNPLIKSLIVIALFFTLVIIIYMNVLFVYSYWDPVLLSPGEGDATAKVTQGFFVFLGVLAFSVVAIIVIFKYLVKLFEEG